MGETADRFRVLIVEDELLIAMELESILKELGQEVVGLAADAEEALSVVNSALPDLAFIDVHLRDGHSGPRIAGALTGARKALVVFVTGSPHHVPDDHAGALGVIAKPWDPQIFGPVIAFVGAYRRGDREMLATAPTQFRLAPWLRAEIEAAGRGAGRRRST